MSRCSARAARGGWLAAATALMLLTCVSCTQLKGVASPDINAQELVGQQVRATTVDGRVLQFTLETVTDDALVGVPTKRIVADRVVLVTERVRFDQIALLERYEFNLGKTLGAVSVIALGLLVGFAIAMSQAEWY